MKKFTYLLAAVTVVFLLILVGFFLGRIYRGTVVYVETEANSDVTVLKPKIEETKGPKQTETNEPERTESAESFGQPVNINTADAEQLQTLNGIGQKLAERIIEYRTNHGPFQTIEEIQNVSGIGSGIFEQIQANITVG